MGANTLTAIAALLALCIFAIALLLFCLYLLNRRAFYGLRVLLNKQVYKNLWVFITTGTKPLTLNLSEDDYYSPMVVLLPQKNARHCREEFKKLAEIEKTKIIHKEGFISYGSIYMLKEAPYRLSDSNINVKEIEGVFSPLPKFSSLSLSYKEIHIKNTSGYGFPSCTIFAAYDEEKVTALWIRKSHLENEAQFNRLSATLNDVGKKWDLILVDWQKREIINLKNTKEVKAYLKREIEEATKGSEYLIRVKGALFPNQDPGIKTEYVDKNPFGFKRIGIEWTLAHKDGRTFSLSPEPPGLQVSFSRTNKKDEKDILKYLQVGISEMTEIIPIT